GTTGTTAAITGAPLLGVPTGLHLVVDPSVPASGFDIDLDTGGLSEVMFGAPVASTPEGLFTLGRSAVWRPFPLDEATAVDLGPAVSVWPIAGGVEAWTAGPRVIGSGQRSMRLLRLDDGSEVVRIDLEPLVNPVGASTVGVVVSDGTTAAILRRSGRPEPLAPGAVVAVGPDSLLQERCEASGPPCALVLVDLATGDEVTLHRSAWRDGPSEAAIGASGGVALVRPAADGTVELVIAAPSGAALVTVPTGLATRAEPVWSGDGRFVVVGAGVDVVAVDLGQQSGPAVHRFQVPRGLDGGYALIGPPIP
nr:hypothetical protein [Acidimicrobiia bacterium]